METTFESGTLSVRINRAAREVYAFASVPENFPTWAAGLGTSLTRVNGAWIAQTPQGSIKVRFTARNDFGVLDHYVTPNGAQRSTFRCASLPTAVAAKSSLRCSA